MNESGPVKVYVEPWLDGCCHNLHSQYGEDGLLSAILARIGIANHWCIEVGAYDGQKFSNVAHLIEQGWNALLVEQDAGLYAKCRERYRDNPRVNCVRQYVYPWTFEALLDTAGVDFSLDVASIDIDEQDFWLWAGMQRYRPRVVVIEFGLGRPEDQVPPLLGYNREPVPWIQAGRNMIHYLGRAKGYSPVAITECNFLFVRQDLLP